MEVNSSGKQLPGGSALAIFQVGFEGGHTETSPNGGAPDRLLIRGLEFNAAFGYFSFLTVLSLLNSAYLWLRTWKLAYVTSLQPPSD